MPLSQLLPHRVYIAILEACKIGAYYFMRNRVQKALNDVVKYSSVQAVHVEATNLCNAACAFCAYPMMERPQRVMDMDLFKKIVDKSVAAGVSTFDLTPVVGDPFADKFFFDRLEYISEVGASKVGFTTNSIAFGPKKIDALFRFRAEHPDLKVLMTISLGGFDKETYLEIFRVDKFERVARNIEHLLKTAEKNESSLPINIRAKCPPARSHGPFYDMIAGYRDKGICSLALGENAYGNWGGKVDTEELKRIGFAVAKPPRSFHGPCNLMFFHGVVVSTEGIVNACACRDVELTLPIGNIAGDRSLEDVLSGSERMVLINDFMEGRIPKHCRSCSDYHSVFDPTAKFFKKYVMHAYGDPFKRKKGKPQTIDKPAT